MEEFRFQIYQLSVDSLKVGSQRQPSLESMQKLPAKTWLP